MTSKRVDQILLFIGMGLILISSYQLFFYSPYGSAIGKNLGTLAQTIATVKIKNPLALDWRDAFSGSAVSEDQLIYTDSKSKADIKFVGGSELSIGENSLVRLGSLDKNGLNVKRGFIRAKLEGNKPLIVEMNGTEYTLTGNATEVQINIQADKGQIGVLSGELRVEQSGKVENINTKSALTLLAGEMKKTLISIKLEEPTLNQQIYTIENSHALELKWSPQMKGSVHFARSADFKNEQIAEGEGSVALNLIPGSYYWKVLNAEGGTSLVGHFSILREVPITIIRPHDGDEMLIPDDGSGTSSVLLQWKGSPQESYTIEHEFNGNVKTVSLTALNYTLPIPVSGPYGFRIKTNQENRPLAQWTPWQRIQMTVIPPPMIPTNLQPDAIELQTYDGQAEKIELSWTANGPVQWELVAPGMNPEQKIIEGQIHEVLISQAGTYRWRVRGIDKLKRGSDWSDWQTFLLEDLSQAKNAEGIQRVQLKRPDQEVTFNWVAEKEAQNVFELSRDKGFVDVVTKREIKGESAKVVIPKPGVYFWRSRQFNSDGTMNVTEPRRVIIEPAPHPVKPEKLPDMEILLELKSIKKKSTFLYLLELIIPTAYADEFMGVATIELPKKDDVKNYIIRIFADEDGSDLVLERTLVQNTFQWTDVRPGSYYWQYALVDFWNRQSPFSDLSVLKVTMPEIPSPQKPQLSGSTRGKEVDKKEVSFVWSSDKNAVEYEFELAQTEDFDEVIHHQKLKTTKLQDLPKDLSPGTYYWRVTSSNRLEEKKVSEVEEFFIKEPTLMSVTPAIRVWRKKFKPRLSFAWSPSKDSYEFKDGQDGVINGNALNSFEAKGTLFRPNWVLGAEVLRQTGKVFKSESYLFQRLLVNGTWRNNFENHLWGPGFTVGQVSGFAYEISNSVVKGKSTSGLVYGPHVRAHFGFSARWELETKASYLLGAIKQMEVTLELLRRTPRFYLLMGTGLSLRDYEVSSGKQSSLRLILGVGKEF